jgi:rhodanese-related sulfurtransferase
MPSEPQPRSLEISCQTAKQRLSAVEPVVLLDCREPDEYETVHIEGARLVPMSQIVDRVGELEAFRGQPIIVYCHHGGRSLRVANWLRQQGFADVQSLAGGIDRWAVEIDSTLARY